MKTLYIKATLQNGAYYTILNIGILEVIENEQRHSLLRLYFEQYRKQFSSMQFEVRGLNAIWPFLFAKYRKSGSNFHPNLQL
jgi:hypothetical protein